MTQPLRAAPPASRRRGKALTALLLSLSACGTTTGGEGEASCAAVVEFEGTDYYGTAVQRKPEAGIELGTGVFPPCNDTNDSEGEESETVTILELKDTSPEVAVLVEGDTSTVWVAEGAELPAEAESKLDAPSCDSRDAPIRLFGEWLGILGADGNTELDLEPPYDLDILVTEASSERYMGSYLTIRVPSEAGQPITHDDVESSLWGGGNVDLEVNCDGARFIATKVTAEPPPP